MEPRATDEEAIRSVARAYLESWLDGDGERMRGALHPDLAKRGLDYAADRRPSGVHHLTAEYVERSTANGPRPQFARTCEITVLDVADSIASAKVLSEPFVDYLHLATRRPMVDRQRSVRGPRVRDRDRPGRSVILHGGMRPSN